MTGWDPVPRLVGIKCSRYSEQKTTFRKQERTVKKVGYKKLLQGKTVKINSGSKAWAETTQSYDEKQSQKAPQEEFESLKETNSFRITNRD